MHCPCIQDSRYCNQCGRQREGVSIEEEVKYTVKLSAHRRTEEVVPDPEPILESAPTKAAKEPEEPKFVQREQVPQARPSSSLTPLAPFLPPQAIRLLKSMDPSYHRKTIAELPQPHAGACATVMLLGLCHSVRSTRSSIWTISSLPPFSTLALPSP